MRELERKLYQLIISRLDGDKISSISYRERAFRLVQKGIGGFIVFGGGKDEVKGFIDKLQAAAEDPLFIASDIERGVGQQIEGAVNFPSHMAVAAAINKDSPEDVQLLKDMVRAIANEAADVGINMPLIPVMDVNQNPDNPIICTRAFSDKPEEVAWFGKMYINEIEAAGLISCAKHFPGHGDTDVDSHISLPTISKTRHELIDTDVYPFREAVNAGVSSIMAGHLDIPEIDSLPVPLSEKIINGLLRKELGFDGLILTDALNMHALNEFENVAAKCINAGFDILLHPADADAVVEGLKQNISSGEIDAATIDAAFERIRECKIRIRNIKKSPVDSRVHKELSELISEKAVTMVKGTPGPVLFKGFENSYLAFLGNENDVDVSPLKNMISRSVDIRKVDFEKTLLGETVFIVLFTDIAAWKGSSGISGQFISKIQECINKADRSVVISFGSPYVLRHFQEADMLIAAYDTTKQAQDSVIKCLKGERNFEGLLPVDMSVF